MTLPAQLRDIADRIEAIDAARTLVLAELDALAARPDGPRIVRMEDLTEPQQEVVKALLAAKASADSASVQVADEDQPGEATVGLGATPAPIHAGGGAGNEDPAPSSANEQATSGERARGRMNVTVVPPARIPASPGNESPGRGAAGAVGSPVPAFDPLTLATCPECGHEVKSRGLGTHRRLRHGYAASDSVKAPVRCPDCGKAIAQSQNLTRHRQQVHGGQKRGGNGAAAPVIRKGRETFLCSRCPESFSSRDALDTHLVVAHPDTTTRRLPVGEQPSVLASLGVE